MLVSVERKSDRLLGVNITVIEQLDHILNETDRDLIQPVIDDLISKNTTFLTGTKV